MSDLPPGPWEWSASGDGGRFINLFDADGLRVAWWPCEVDAEAGLDELPIMLHLVRCARALHGVPVDLIESGAVRDALKMQGVLPMED